jgi:hypothetical protein
VQPTSLKVLNKFALARQHVWTIHGDKLVLLYLTLINYCTLCTVFCLKLVVNYCTITVCLLCFDYNMQHLLNAGIIGFCCFAGYLQFSGVPKGVPGAMAPPLADGKLFLRA